MTYNDLCEEVKALGFEDELESSTRTFFAANRALRAIYTERPVYDTLTIYRADVQPYIRIDRIDHKGGEGDTLSFTARAYSFKSSGNGEFVINDTGGERTVSFSGNGTLHKGFLYGEGRISFIGEYAFSIFDIALFDDILSESVEDIPTVDGTIKYNAEKLVNNFLSFASLPTDETGSVIRGSSTLGSSIYIPYGFSGRINAIYKVCPRLSEDPLEEIPIPTGCDHLLPLLTAAYVWLDDDEEKSRYYMSLYREGLNAAKYYDRASFNATYNETNGWA